jgi:hypothetical protein
VNVFVVAAYDEEANLSRLLDDLVRERGFACKAELLFKLSRLGARLEEVPVAIDWSAREGESKMRVLPTVVAYLRLMTRQVFARRGEAAA